MTFSAENYIDSLLSQPNYLPPDLVIDDSSIIEAKNVVEFLHDDNFIGNMIPTKLFPRQLEIVIKLFADYCPNCTDLDYFGEKDKSKISVNESLDTILNKVQLLEYGICPKCKGTKSEFYLNNQLNVNTEFVGLLGQRAGKSALSSMILAYLTHKFLKVPNLQKTYNLLPSSPFVIPMVAMSFDKAKLLLYNAFYEYLTKGNWFKAYYDFLDNEIAEHGLKTELYAVKDTFTRFKHKNILIAPFGPDKRKLRGNTSISSAVDEIGWFLPGAIQGIKFDADEIYTSINNSLMTAKEAYLKLLSQGYNNLPPPININISSPSSKKDKICRLYKDSQYDRYMLGFHLSTWEVNPNLPIDGPTMSALKKKNEKDFWRDFGAIPPNSSNPFFDSLDLFIPLLTNNSNICKITKLSSFIGNNEYTYGKVIFPKKENIKPARILALDAGFNNNSFAFSVAHIKRNNGYNEVIYDALTEIIPDDNRPIDYTKVFSDIILPMIKELNVKLVVTDRWQNIKLLSDIRNNKSLKTETQSYSLKYSDFMNFKQYVFENKVFFPKSELKIEDIESTAGDSYPYCFENYPVSHFLYQTISVVDMMGKTVSKGEGTTDDIFRAAVLAHSIIIRDENEKLFKGNIIYNDRNRGLAALPGNFTFNKSNIIAISS